jgi:hypothetical protein
VALAGNQSEVALTTDANAPIKTTYEIRQKTTSAVIDIAESSFRDEKILDIALSIANIDRVEDKKIINIIDLGINPINPMAMMRDIPLNILYNYSYTFDSMLVQILYESFNDYGNQLLLELCRFDAARDNAPRGDLARIDSESRPIDNNDYKVRASTTKELFLNLLVNPFKKLLNPRELQMFDMIMKGDSSLPLARPKFLSDEIYNKVLFMDIYNNSNMYQRHEHGPVGKRMRPKDILTRITDTRYLLGQVDPRDDRNDQHHSEITGPRTVDPQQKIAEIHLHPTLMFLLRIIGKLRANTLFVRNVMLIVNAYRIVRYKLRNDLSYGKSLVVRSHAALREDNTEFERAQTYAARPL